MRKKAKFKITMKLKKYVITALALTMDRHSFYKITLTAVLLVALFTGLPKVAFAQKQTTTEGEFEIYFNTYWLLYYS